MISWTMIAAIAKATIPAPPPTAATAKGKKCGAPVEPYEPQLSRAHRDRTREYEQTDTQEAAARRDIGTPSRAASHTRTIAQPHQDISRANDSSAV